MLFWLHKKWGHDAFLAVHGKWGHMENGDMMLFWLHGKWGHDAFLAAQKSIMSPFSAHFPQKIGGCPAKDKLAICLLFRLGY